MKKTNTAKETLKLVALGIISTIIIITAYIKSRNIDTEKHTQLREKFSEFRQADTSLNQHMLEIRQGFISNYDSTARGIHQLEQITAEIHNLLLQLQLTTKKQQTLLRKKLDNIKKTVSQKQQYLEIFKSRLATLRNSQLFLPLATTHLIANMGDNPSYNHITEELNALLRNTLIYISNTDMTLLPEIKNGKKNLQKQISHLQQRLKEEIHSILLHVDIIIKNKGVVDTYLQNTLALPTIKNVDDLQHFYEELYNAKLEKSAQYKNLLTFLAIISLLTLFYALFHLNYARIRLKNTINDLNYQKFAMDQHAIVSITDNSGNIKYANEKFCEISQHDADELIGKNHRIVKSTYHPPSFYKQLWNTISQGQVWRGKICNKAKNGKLYWVDTTIVPFVNENNQPYQYVAIRTDITEHIETEENLRIQATALETVESGIVITDKQGIIQWVNAATCRMTGYSKNELLGKTPDIWKSDKHDNAFYQNLWDTVLSGKSWHGETINKRKNGELYTEEQTISPVHDDQGNIIRLVAVKQDISERKLQEEKLRHSQKMDALGQLTGGIAHDYNNMLGVVLGYTELLEDIIQDQEQKDYLKQIYNSAQRGAKLTQKLLSFSRHHNSNADVVDISNLLLEDRNMLQKTLTARITLNIETPDEHWLTWLDSSDLEDAILNMCINSMHAIEGNGAITLKVENSRMDNKMASQLGIKENDYVILSVTDNGSGMDEATTEKIFDPFYSTKGEQGTGLGLSQVYGFVERSHGTIKVYSEPGKGTSIKLYFPRHTGLEHSQTTTDNMLHTQLRGTEKILIVDDEPALLRLSSEILKNHGYQIHIAESAQQALHILENEEIDLVLSDIIMPEMNGYELADIIKKKYPAIVIQLASGFSSNPQQVEADKNLLQKPFKMDELLHCVRQLLDNRQK